MNGDNSRHPFSGDPDIIFCLSIRSMRTWEAVRRQFPLSRHKRRPRVEGAAVIGAIDREDRLIEASVVGELLRRRAVLRHQTYSKLVRTCALLVPKPLCRLFSIRSEVLVTPQPREGRFPP